MASRYFGPIKWVGGAAVIVFAIGLLWVPFKEAVFSEETQNEVLVNAIPFLATFIAILLIFILTIVLLARRFNGKLPRRLYASVEFIAIAGIGASVVMLFQPWQLVKEQLGWVPAEIMWLIASALILTAILSIRGLSRGLASLLDLARLAVIVTIFIAIIEAINDGIDFIPMYILGGLATLLVLAAIYFGEQLPILEDYETNERGIMAGFVIAIVIFLGLVVRELDWVPADVGAVKTVQDEAVQWMNNWQLIGFEFGFLLLMFSTLFYILWSHIVPGSRAVDLSVRPLTSRHHMMGVIVGLVLVVIIAGGLATLNQPAEPYGMRQRQFDSLGEEQQAEIEDQANEDFIFIEIPFLIFLGLFPASIVYYVTREASLAMEDSNDIQSMSHAVPGSESVAT